MTATPTLFDALESRRTLRDLALDHVRAAGAHGATAAEVVDALQGRSQQNVVAKRLSELRDDGLIEAVGKRPGPWGPPLTVWRAA